MALFQDFSDFFWVGQIFCDYHYINPVLWVNGSLDFDDLGTNQEQI